MLNRVLNPKSAGLVVLLLAAQSSLAMVDAPAPKKASKVPYRLRVALATAMAVLPPTGAVLHHGVEERAKLKASMAAGDAYMREQYQPLRTLIELGGEDGAIRTLHQPLMRRDFVALQVLSHDIGSKEQLDELLKSLAPRTAEDLKSVLFDEKVLSEGPILESGGAREVVFDGMMPVSVAWMKSDDGPVMEVLVHNLHDAK